jgi:hypothetical protein
MLLPTSQTLARDLSQQFTSHNVEKTYLALVRGGAQSFPEKEGMLQERLVLEDGRARKARKDEEGTPTKTRWELMASSVSLICLDRHLILSSGHSQRSRSVCCGFIRRQDISISFDFTVLALKVFLGLILGRESRLTIIQRPCLATTCTPDRDCLRALLRCRR